MEAVLRGLMCECRGSRYYPSAYERTGWGINIIYNTRDYVLMQGKVFNSLFGFFLRGILGLIRVLGRKGQRLQLEETPAPKPIEPEKTLAPISVPEWPPFFTEKIKKIPVGLKQRKIVYGDPSISIGASGNFKVSREFARNLGIIPAGDFRNYGKRLYMHKLVAPFFVEAMRRAYQVCPEWRPERIGCFNPRRMRHSKNPRVPFSDHAFAIAVDIDPSKNRAWSRRKHPDRPRPFEDGWENYSSIPKEVVESFKSVGFDWGGDWKTFVDPMHFSLRKLGK